MDSFSERFYVSLVHPQCVFLLCLSKIIVVRMREYFWVGDFPFRLVLESE